MGCGKSSLAASGGAYDEVAGSAASPFSSRRSEHTTRSIVQPASILGDSLERSGGSLRGMIQSLSKLSLDHLDRSLDRSEHDEDLLDTDDYNSSKNNYTRGDRRQRDKELVAEATTIQHIPQLYMMQQDVSKTPVTRNSKEDALLESTLLRLEAPISNNMVDGVGEAQALIRRTMQNSQNSPDKTDADVLEFVSLTKQKDITSTPNNNHDTLLGDTDNPSTHTDSTPATASLQDDSSNHRSSITSMGTPTESQDGFLGESSSSATIAIDEVGFPLETMSPHPHEQVTNPAFTVSPRKVQEKVLLSPPRKQIMADGNDESKDKVADGDLDTSSGSNKQKKKKELKEIADGNDELKDVVPDDKEDLDISTESNKKKKRNLSPLKLEAIADGDDDDDKVKNSVGDHKGLDISSGSNTLKKRNPSPLRLEDIADLFVLDDKVGGGEDVDISAGSNKKKKKKKSGKNNKLDSSSGHKKKNKKKSKSGRGDDLDDSTRSHTRSRLSGGRVDDLDGSIRSQTRSRLPGGRVEDDLDGSMRSQTRSRLSGGADDLDGSMRSQTRSRLSEEVDDLDGSIRSQTRSRFPDRVDDLDGSARSQTRSRLSGEVDDLDGSMRSQTRSRLPEGVDDLDGSMRSQTRSRLPGGRVDDLDDSARSKTRSRLSEEVDDLGGSIRSQTRSRLPGRVDDLDGSARSQTRSRLKKNKKRSKSGRGDDLDDSARSQTRSRLSGGVDDLDGSMRSQTKSRLPGGVDDLDGSMRSQTRSRFPDEVDDLDGSIRSQTRSRLSGEVDDLDGSMRSQTRSRLSGEVDDLDGSMRSQTRSRFPGRVDDLDGSMRSQTRSRLPGIVDDLDGSKRSQTRSRLERLSKENEDELLKEFEDTRDTEQRKSKETNSWREELGAADESMRSDTNLSELSSRERKARSDDPPRQLEVESDKQPGAEIGVYATPSTTADNSTTPKILEIESSYSDVFTPKLSPPAPTGSHGIGHHSVTANMSSTNDLDVSQTDCVANDVSDNASLTDSLDTSSRVTGGLDKSSRRKKKKKQKKQSSRTHNEAKQEGPRKGEKKLESFLLTENKRQSPQKSHNLSLASGCKTLNDHVANESIETESVTGGSLDTSLRAKQKRKQKGKSASNIYETKHPTHEENDLASYLSTENKRHSPPKSRNLSPKSYKSWKALDEQLTQNLVLEIDSIASESTSDTPRKLQKDRNSASLLLELTELIEAAGVTELALETLARLKEKKAELDAMLDDRSANTDKFGIEESNEQSLVKCDGQDFDSTSDIKEAGLEKPEEPYSVDNNAHNSKARPSILEEETESKEQSLRAKHAQDSDERALVQETKADDQMAELHTATFQHLAGLLSKAPPHTQVSANEELEERFAAAVKSCSTFESTHNEEGVPVNSTDSGVAPLRRSLSESCGSNSLEDCVEGDETDIKVLSGSSSSNSAQVADTSHDDHIQATVKSNNAIETASLNVCIESFEESMNDIDTSLDTSKRSKKKIKKKRKSGKSIREKKGEDDKRKGNNLGRYLVEEDRKHVDGPLVDCMASIASGVNSLISWESIESWKTLDEQLGDAESIGSSHVKAAQSTDSDFDARTVSSTPSQEVNEECVEYSDIEITTVVEEEEEEDCANWQVDVDGAEVCQDASTTSHEIEPDNSAVDFHRLRMCREG